MPLIRDDTLSLVSCLSCGFLGSNWFFKFKLSLSSLALSSCVFFSLRKTRFLMWVGSTSFLVPLFHPCGTLVHAGEMYVFFYAKLTLYIKAITWLQTSAVPALHVHHEVKILQSFFVPSKHTQTLCGSSRIFCEGDTKAFKNTCLLSIGHFVNKIVSTKPLIQQE